MDEYEYEVGGLHYTALLTPEHAKRLGAKKVDRTAGKARTPANKARTAAENKGATRRGTRRTARDT